MSVPISCCYRGLYLCRPYCVLQSLFQSTIKEWRHASWSLTDSERKYTQIEKEVLAVMWACEKFRDYILGCQVKIETDLKPLVPLFSNKRLDGLSSWVLRFCLRLDRFDYQIYHVPGTLFRQQMLFRALLTLK